MCVRENGPTKWPNKEQYFFIFVFFARRTLLVSAIQENYIERCIIAFFLQRLVHFKEHIQFERESDYVNNILPN